jgi:hypothetical protein
MNASVESVEDEETGATVDSDGDSEHGGNHWHGHSHDSGRVDTTQEGAGDSDHGVREVLPAATTAGDFSFSFHAQGVHGDGAAVVPGAAPHVSTPARTRVTIPLAQVDANTVANCRRFRVWCESGDAAKVATLLASPNAMDVATNFRRVVLMDDVDAESCPIFTAATFGHDDVVLALLASHVVRAAPSWCPLHTLLVTVGYTVFWR